MFFTVNLQQDKSQLSSYLSNTLLDKIDETLEKGEKVLLYLNKRGSYSSLICEDCQHLFECPNCDTSLSVHSNPDHLRCHICNNAYNIPKSCPKCSKNTLKSIGVGTQQIESILKGHYKPHLGISSPGGEEGYSIRKGYGQIPGYVRDLSKNLREHQTPAEEILWQLLRNRKFHNLKFRRQHAIGRYIADFYCHESKFIIELDGKIHDKQKEYDNIRNEVIQSHGITVIRFKNEEFGKNIEQTYLYLEQKLCSLSLLKEREFKSEVRGRKHINIYRFDSDAMKNISSKKAALGELEKSDIIIGTKMVSTGFDFEKIGLICVLLVESELAYPSYDAEEKAYSNLRQIIGRGNRKSQKTTILLQTFIPKNPLLQQTINLNFKDFLGETLKERKQFGYPPYKQMVTLEYRHKDSKKALKFTQDLEKELHSHSEGNYQFLRGGSSFKKNNSHHTTLIIKGENIRDLLKNIENIILKESGLSVIFH